MMRIDVCEEVGTTLSFGCTEGNCGVCELAVVTGRENLNKSTEEDLEKGMRLGSQLKI